MASCPSWAEHYWSPVVEEIKGSGDTEQQIEALFAHVPDNEPTVGGFTFSKWEPGAFFENDAAPNYAWKGMVVTEYETALMPNRTIDSTMMRLSTAMLRVQRLLSMK